MAIVNSNIVALFISIIKTENLGSKGFIASYSELNLNLKKKFQQKIKEKNVDI